MKQKTISQLRRDADKYFSLAVRYRDGRQVNGEWQTQCITCQAWKPLKTMHLGHFMSRRFPSTRWDSENCNGQCAGCNTFNNGEQYKYSLALDLKYGKGTAHKLHELSKQYFKVRRDFLEQVISDAKEEILWYESS